MTKQIFQIKIVLKGSKPRIWRRILIPSNLSLSDFHLAIQVVMGWTNSHLHQFIKDDLYYTMRLQDDDFWDEMNYIDYKGMMIRNLLSKEKDRVIYEYDFGDSWIHDVLLEAIVPKDSTLKYPVCLAGKMSCPPEDCGGIWGYADMLEILKNPEHEEYESYVEWLDEDFDPKYFSVEEVNKRLRLVF
ncbi:MAG: plasmid pRiA4b ORF-3 family protein [Microbacter sp.]